MLYTLKAGISEGEQFVRAETGRAAWKLVNKPEEDDPIVAGRSEEEQQEEDKRQDENRGEFGGIQEENEGGENEEMKHAEEEEIATSQEDSHNQLEDAVELSAPPIAEHTADANVPQEDTKVMCVDTMPPQTEGNDVLGPCEIADSQGNTSGVPADTNVEPDELIDDEGKAVEAECWSNQGDNDGAIATTANTE